MPDCCANKQSGVGVDGAGWIYFITTKATDALSSLHLLSNTDLSQLALLPYSTYFTPCRRYSVTADREISPAV